MGGLTGRRLVLAAVTITVLVVGGGAAYAFSETGGGSEEHATPLTAKQPAASATSATPSPSGTTTAPPTPTPTATSSSSSAAPAAATATATPAAANTGACQTGEHQREVETYLAQLGGYGTIQVDGVQSDADCAAITAFQTRFGIAPAAGRAGPTTLDVARRIATSATAAEQAKCGAGSEVTVCVDLTLQTTWVARGGQVVAGPTVTRTGMAGYATPAGTYRVYARNLREWSKPYKVWLPYWQAFNGGMGLHETTTYIHNMGAGSHGCVNLLHNDAVAFWNLTTNGTTVRTFGHRSGT